jgi:DNA-binding HxlR family transcriptional regulator
MERTSFAEMDCPVARTLEVVGDWWTLLIIREVFMGGRRFDQIQRRLGVARNILTTRLRGLIESGILERRPYQTRPPRFEYLLTEKGLDLFPIVVALNAWGDRWQFGSDAVPVKMVHRTCAHDSQAQTVCGHCGSVLHSDDIEYVFSDEYQAAVDLGRQQQVRGTA